MLIFLINSFLFDILCFKHVDFGTNSLLSNTNFSRCVEHDLNLEIDRLVQASAEQKRKIAELECRVLSGKLDLEYPEEMQEVSTKIKFIT